VTESQWLAATDPMPMLVCLRDQFAATRTAAARRKLRLFVCASCRRALPLLQDQRCWRAVEVAERAAEREASAGELAEAKAAAQVVARAALFRPRTGGGIDREWHAAEAAYRAAEAQVWTAAAYAPHEASLAAGNKIKEDDKVQCDLLRCVFGNPFRPVAVDRAWQTPTIVSLAQAAYDERLMPSGELEPTRTGVLADALEDTGASALVEHLRWAGPHVRGCWPLDLLLEKERRA
jgi:hypothetical protein